MFQSKKKKADSKLEKAFQNNPTELSIPRGLGYGGLEALAEILKVNQTLQKINFNWFAIGNKGAGRLADALKVNHSLQEIKIDISNIDDDGAEMLAEALKVNQTLQRLTLDTNDVSDRGAGNMAEALKVNQTLEKINFKGNKIGDRGAGKLAEALKVNQTLKWMILRKNKIGDRGAGMMAEALKVNQTLQELDLKHNKIADEGAGKLVEALQANRTLEVLNLKGNSFNDEYIHIKIDSVLNDPERRGKRDDKSAPCQSESNFYTKLMSMTEQNLYTKHDFDDLRHLISDLITTKFFYTAMLSLKRAGLVTDEIASFQIIQALDKATELCEHPEDVADYKLILEKAEHDGHIDRRQMHCFDNRAERNAVFTDRRFVSLADAVKSNTARIEGLEANVEAINNSVNAIRKGLKHKMKVEAVVGFLSATINAVSFGVGGNILSATASALSTIVDYGDIVHIRAVAAMNGDVCVDQVEAGINIAVNRYADLKLEKAVQKGNILTVVAATAIMMDPSSDSQKSSKEMGDEAFRCKDFQEAIEHYSKAIQEDGNSAHLFSKRSVAYRKMGDAEKAIVDASRAIKLDPKNKKAYYNMATALHDLKRFDEVSEVIEKGLLIAPDNALLNKAFKQLEGDEEFKAHRVNTLRQKGSVFHGKSNYSNAIECFTKAIVIDNSNYNLFLDRCTAYIELGDFENALRDAGTSIDLESNNPKGYWLKGRALCTLNRFQEASSVFKEGQRKFPGAIELKEGLLVTEECVKRQKARLDPEGDHFINISEQEDDQNTDAAREEDEMISEGGSSGQLKTKEQNDSVMNSSFKHRENAISVTKKYNPGSDCIPGVHSDEYDHSVSGADKDEQYDFNYDISEIQQMKDLAESGHLCKHDIVKSWLLSSLPDLDKFDADRYSKVLINDGFDSIATLSMLQEDDLHFMKRGHMRFLLTKLSESSVP